MHLRHQNNESPVKSATVEMCGSGLNKKSRNGVCGDEQPLLQLHDCRFRNVDDQWKVTRLLSIPGIISALVHVFAIVYFN